jgi:hypothetical protein
MPLSIPDLDFFHGRYLHLEDLAAGIHGFDALLQISLDPVFISGIGMNYIPAFFTFFYPRYHFTRPLW